MNGPANAVAEPVGDLIFVPGRYAMNDHENKIEKTRQVFGNVLKNAPNNAYERLKERRACAYSFEECICYD